MTIDCNINSTRTLLRSVLFIFLFCLGMASGYAKSYTVKQVPDVQKADRTKLVSDPDNYLSPQTRARMDSLLVDIRNKTSAEVVVVVIGEMGGESDIDSYATSLFEEWGIGKKDKDNGLLVLVAVEDREYTLRTGYGMEGVLPDLILADIGDRILEPSFKENDYDGGLLQATRQLHSIITDPAVRDELLSSLEAKEREDWMDFLWFVFYWCVALTLFTALWFGLAVYKHRNGSPYEKYMAVRTMKVPLLACSIFGVGMPLPVYLILIYKMHSWRDGKHHCPNCNTLMNKLDEESDNSYLTPGQDKEERLNSVDYDVWLCPNCGETDVYSFVNTTSPFTECPVCHARTLSHEMDRVLVQATERHEGHGIRRYVCLNCGHRDDRPYRIAKLASPVVIIGGFGGGSGGGGSIGGGFGGGSTGGGGFSGKW